MKTARYILCALACVLLLGACKEWLDVVPSTQVRSKDMFKKEDGFRDALLGVYTTMGEAQGYGAHQTFATLDVIAQTYSAIAQQYENAYRFEYDESFAETAIDGIWRNNYFAIANCNDILAHVDVSRGVFTNKGTYEIVKAETMALRAYLHLDLLRIFGPVPTATNLDKPAIPLALELSPVSGVQLSINEIVDYVIREVDEARKLIATYDPMMDDDYDEEKYYEGYQPGIDQYVDGGFMLFRRSRLNYYGMTALMARAALWTGRNAEALTYAREVIEAGKFPMADEMVFSKESDLVVWSADNEYITGLYKYKMKEKVHDTYIDIQNLSTVPVTLLYTTNDLLNIFGEDRDIDWRYRKFVRISGNGDYYTTKYTTGHRIPLLKIAEMYLIAAEASGDISWLNELRDHRGFANNRLPADTDLRDALTSEYRREFMSEGQVFHYYKRRNFGAFPNGTAAGEKVYVLPVPDEETEFGNLKN